jgi:hypothetical protein
MWARFNVREFRILPTEHIYVILCISNNDFSLHNTKSLFFITETEYLYCALQTESLNITEDKFSL